MLSTLIIIRHKENIQRLLKGEESKVSRKKRPKTLAAQYHSNAEKWLDNSFEGLTFK